MMAYENQGPDFSCAVVFGVLNALVDFKAFQKATSLKILVDEMGT